MTLKCVIFLSHLIVGCLQALAYAFKLSSDGYQFDVTSEVGRKSKLVKDRYRMNRMVPYFVVALSVVAYCAAFCSSCFSRRTN